MYKHQHSLLLALLLFLSLLAPTSLHAQFQHFSVNAHDSLALKVRAEQVEQVQIAPGGAGVTVRFQQGGSSHFVGTDVMNMAIHQAQIPLAFFQQSVEPEYLTRFIRETQYDPNDYSYSVVKDYVPAEKGRFDYPRPYVFRLKEFTKGLPSREFPPCELLVSRTDDFSHAEVCPFEADSAVLRTAIPRDTLRYRIRRLSDGQILQQGQALVEGQVRLIYLESVDNVRDIGGWPVEDGGRLRYGRLFRGSKLHTAGKTFITPADVQRMRALDLHVEFDLRGITEANDNNKDYAYSRLGDDVAYQIINYGSMAYTQIFDKPQIMRLEWQYTVGNVLAGKNVFYHCSRGCDRVGTLSVLLEGVLGVSENNLCLDYEISSFCGPNGTRTRNEKYVVPDYDFEGMMATIKSYPGATLRDKFEYFWVNVCGVSAEQVEQFRRIMIDRTAVDAQDGRSPHPAL